MDPNALLEHRILFLSEAVTPKIANDLVAQLLLLDAKDSRRPIDLYINSPGGSVTDGFAIIDAILGIEAPVSTICIGQASSMAAWILASGSRGKRFVSPHAEVMIHQVASSFSGQTSDLQIYFERMKRHQEKLIELMAGWTGQPASKVEADMRQEFFMTAEEARAYGIVDRVLEAYRPAGGAA